VHITFLVPSLKKEGEEEEEKATIRNCGNPSITFSFRVLKLLN